MPFSGSEILEVASGNPSIGCTVGNYVVSIDAGRASPSGTLPLSGTFSVMDSTTGQALVYTGLPTTNVTTYGRCVSEGGFAWFVSGINLYRITPSTGAISTIASGATGLAVAALPGKIYVLVSSAVCRIYDIAAGTWSNGASTGTANPTTAVGVAPDRIVVGRTGAAANQVLDDTGAVIGGIPPSFGGSTNAKGAGVAIGSKAYLPIIGSSSMDVIDPYALTYTSLSVSPNVYGRNVCLGHDGWLYTYDTAADQIIGVSPVTGAVDVGTPSTARTRRYTVYSANSELWIPSGDPL